jgi:hypothetical protein
VKGVAVLNAHAASLLFPFSSPGDNLPLVSVDQQEKLNDYSFGSCIGSGSYKPGCSCVITCDVEASVSLQAGQMLQVYPQSFSDSEDCFFATAGPTYFPGSGSVSVVFTNNCQEAKDGSSVGVEYVVFTYNDNARV